MQPTFDCMLNVPEGMNPDDAVNKEAYGVPPLQGRWEKGLNYLLYSKRCFNAYY